VVDAANPERFSEAAHELEGLKNAPELAGIPFLILGNKIDLPTAVSDEQLIMNLKVGAQTPLEVPTVPHRTQAIRVFMCSVKSKVGYADGFKWLAKFI
jgi:GTP-binding protein SAR1